MMKWPPSVYAFALLAANLNVAVAQDLPSPLALLRGVEQARTKFDSASVAVELQQVEEGNSGTATCTIEMDGSRLRSEVLLVPGGGEVIIRDGDTFHAMRRKEHEDVHVYNIDRAVGVRGDIAFDPRILGLSDQNSVEDTVEKCLWLHNYENLETVGREALRGVDVWRVKVSRSNSAAEYWIEEPGFRVHRTTIQTKLMRIEIHSEFDAGDSLTPFPSRVTATRVTPTKKVERNLLITRFEFGGRTPRDRFTLKSMDIPINTAVVDYALGRRIGFWDGEGLSELPVYTGERPQSPTAPTSRGYSRLQLILLNVIIVAVIILVIWWRTRRQASAA